MTSMPTRLGLAAAAAFAGLCALWFALTGAAAGQPRPPASVDPMQVLADVVLIESRCGTLNVDYGKLFAYAERNGIQPDDVLPLGGRRAAFDAAYRRRAREERAADLCGALAAEREGAVPGVFAPR